MNDTTEKKTLAQIGYESVFGTTLWTMSTWENVSLKTKQQAEAMAQAVKAAVLADLPPVAEQAGELSEEEMEKAWNLSIRLPDKDGVDEPWSYQCKTAREFFLSVARRILSSHHSPSLVVHKTAERPPTEEDGESVFAWVSNAKPPGWWLRGPGVVTSHPTSYTNWFAMPPAPTPEVSEEEKAWQNFLKTEIAYVHFNGWDETAKASAREAFSAGFKHRKL